MPRPKRTITGTTATTLRVRADEARTRFVIPTRPVGMEYAVRMAPTASLALLDDEDTLRGTPCPVCFIERGLNGLCESH